MNGKKDVIRLTNLRFYANHGVTIAERAAGNHFRVDFECYIDLSHAAETDSIAITVDYGEIYEVISEQMSISSDLLENVAYRIMVHVKNKFPQIEEGSITVTKMNPPFNYSIDAEDKKNTSSSITLNF